jgi:hypothetical protein
LARSLQRRSMENASSASDIDVPYVVQTSY